MHVPTHIARHSTGTRYPMNCFTQCTFYFYFSVRLFCSVLTAMLFYDMTLILLYFCQRLVFYVLTIAHTLDVAQRSRARDCSQTFKWFSLPLLFYFCDYTMMYTNKRFEPTVTEFTAIEDHEGSKMIILKMNRPTLFIFKPGQYAFLRVCGIDRAWHPFTIASAPRSNTVEFYIEVFEGVSPTTYLS